MAVPSRPSSRADGDRRARLGRSGRCDGPRSGEGAARPPAGAVCLFGWPALRTRARARAGPTHVRGLSEGAARQLCDAFGGSAASKHEWGWNQSRQVVQRAPGAASRAQECRLCRPHLFCLGRFSPSVGRPRRGVCLLSAFVCRRQARAPTRSRLGLCTPRRLGSGAARLRAGSG